MSARGVNYLEVWIYDNVPHRPGNLMEARELAKKLQADAAAAGITPGDMRLRENEVANYILESMAQLGKFHS